MSTFTTATNQQGLWDYIEKGQTELAVASLQKDLAQIRYTMGHNEDTPLHVIAKKGDAEMLAAVLAVIDPEHVDIRNKNGYTPLMSAGVNGQTDTADILMDAGADVNAASQQGETLLMKAIKGMNQEEVRENEKTAFNHIIDRAITAFGAKVDAKDLSGNTAIDVADLFEDNKTISYLEAKQAQQKTTLKTAPAAPRPAAVSKPA